MKKIQKRPKNKKDCPKKVKHRGGSRRVFAETRRDETLESRREKYRDRKRDKTDTCQDNSRLSIIPDFSIETHFETDMSISRQDETSLESKFRDETGRDGNSRLVSPRNGPRLGLF